MSKREIFFGGSYRMCHVAYQEERWMIVVDDSGHEYICRPGMGTWCAMSMMEMLEAMKRPEAELAAVSEALAQADAAIYHMADHGMTLRPEIASTVSGAMTRHLARLSDTPAPADSG